LPTAWRRLKAAFNPASDVCGQIFWTDVDEIIARIKDHDGRPIGQELLSSLENCDTEEDFYIETDNKESPGCFVGYSRTFPFYKNRIYYKPAAIKDKLTAVTVKIHEGIHALQFAGIAAWHAHPANRETEFVLSPTRFLLLFQALEKDAYIKTACLMKYLWDQEREFKRGIRKSDLASQHIIAFHEATRRTSGTAGSPDVTDETGCLMWKPRKDLYDTSNMAEYVSSLRGRIENRLKTVFVNIDNDDLKGGPTLLDRFAAQLSYNFLVCVMPLVCVFVPAGAGRSPRPEEQNFVHHKPRSAFVH
jgi:hypothetical protein